MLRSLLALLAPLLLTACSVTFDFADVDCTSDDHCDTGYFCSATLGAAGTCAEGERPAATDDDGDGVAIEQGDCDDTDAANFPGNIEVCDGQDNDCTDGADYSDSAGGERDNDGDGALGCAGDCDDEDPARLPDQLEACDGVDNDCDGEVPAAEADGDGDGFRSCDGELAADCDDDDDAVYPGAEEVCDEVDSDCDGSLVDGFDDVDADGVPDCIDDIIGSKDDADLDGWLDENDCAPNDPDIHPGAEEACDEVDSDCDGSIVDEFPDLDGDDTPDCVDLDADGDGADAVDDCDDLDATSFPGNTEECDGFDTDCNGLLDAGASGVPGQEIDADGDGEWPCEGDCDDSDATRLTAATELCDGVDNDCDSGTWADGDEGDADGDGSLACADCDDGDATSAPTLPELCDGLDNDCDGDADFTNAAGGEEDGDADGYFGCSDDCDPADGLIYPGALESCDDTDSDCDGDLVDGESDTDGDDEPDCIDDDDDGDGFIDGQDCAPLDAEINLGATEICDDIDQDCDSDLVEGFDDLDTDGIPDCADDDADNDGLLADADCDDLDPASPAIADDADCDGVETALDCSDSDPSLGSIEDDADCDGAVDCLITSEAQGVGLVRLCGDTFEMGCTAGQTDCQGNESPAHTVTLTRDVWISETEVTQGQWDALMAFNPSDDLLCGSDCPAHDVSWWDAVDYANALSAAEGLAECYVLQGCGISPGNNLECTDAVVTAASGSVYDCEGYRLPTEAEWEFAARAGGDTLYAGGDVATDVGWSNLNSSGIQAVAQKSANAWGLFDFSGNVWEWSWDRYSSTWYSSSPGTDPEGPTFGGARVWRGGGYDSPASSLRVSRRNDFGPNNDYPIVGFRVARSSL